LANKKRKVARTPDNVNYRRELAGRLAFASGWLTIAADMPFFNNSPDDWQRLDWQILRDGGVHLYWRREYLIEDTKWLANHDYDVFELACETWKSQDEMFSDLARVLRLPDYFAAISMPSMSASRTSR